MTRPALLREPRTPEWPSASRQDRQIVLLGPPQSGKTTFLSALNIAFLRRKHDWNFAPADERSADQLIKLSTALTARQEFPEATRLIQPLNWVLNGWAPGSERRFFRRRETKIPVQIGLDMIDVPGETLHSSAIGTRAQSLLIDEIARSDAIIFLFDPIRESEEGDSYEFVYGVLAQVMQRVSALTQAKVGRLPHHIAVCATKFDDPAMYIAAKKMGLVRFAPEEPHLPTVSDAREFFTRIYELSGSNYGRMILRLLESYGNPRRIKYYVTSTIGFNVNPETNRFSEDDYTNVIPPDKSQGPSVIRGPLYPINVAEPVLWLCGQLMKPATSGGSSRT